MESVIERFAETHHLRVRKDECGDPVIPGRKGHQIFDNGDGRLGVLLVFSYPKKWNNRRKLMTAAGFQSRQDGSTEGTALFNPEDHEQSKLAIKIISAKLDLTPEQKKARSARLEAYRRGKAA